MTDGRRISRVIWQVAMMAWVLFAAGFWWGAASKGIAGQEYASWAYSEVCSFAEIVALKDTGIGHPPLFHLLQKSMQALLPEGWPLRLRFLNFLVGSLFTILMVLLLFRRYPLAWFYGALAVSAPLLNAFVFSRMWGLVCLFSLLVLWKGEQYIAAPQPRRLAEFLLFSVMGFLADYNFILLGPYMMRVVLHETRWRRHLQDILGGSLLLLWGGSLLARGISGGEGLSWMVFSALIALLKSAFVVTNLYINFDFYPFFLGISMAGLAVAWLVHWRYRPARRVEGNMLVLISLMVFLALMHAARVHDGLSTRFVALLSAAAVGGGSLWLLRVRRVDRASQNARLCLGIGGGLLVLLTVHPWFWTPLIELRFMIIFLPWVTVLLLKNLSRPVLAVLAIILALSGVWYNFSARVNDVFPAPLVSEGQAVIYGSPSAYATRFIHARQEHPFFLDMSNFDRACRVCRTGSDAIPFQSYRRITVLSLYRQNDAPFLPSEYQLVAASPAGLFPLDRWMLERFNWIYEERFEWRRYENRAAAP